MNHIITKLLAATILFTALSCNSNPKTPVPSSADILIKGGTLYDGTENPAEKSDIAIVGERVVYVGKACSGIEKKCVAKKVIDARGCVVSPGFIDPHDHLEGEAAKPRSKGTENYLRMGVTTAIFGQCGGSQLPLCDYFRKVEEGGVAMNVASFSGHNTIRRAVMGEVNRFATDKEIARMKEILATEMEAGSLGLSTGLFYVPGSFSERREAVELCRTAASYGGIYTTHIRNENKFGLGVYDATLEALEIGREAGCQVNISHIKCLGRSVWGQSEKVAELIESYQASGMKVTADQYPYLASATSMASALTPAWCRDGGIKGMRERFRDPATLEKIKAEIGDILFERGGAEGVLIATRAGEFNGLTLAQAAEKMGVDPVTAIISILSDENLKPHVNTFTMSDGDMEYYMKKPWVMTCTDGSYGQHPRAAGTYALLIQEYVLNKKVLTLGEMIRRSSGLVAETYKLKDRGIIRDGAYADVLVFRPEEVRANSTYLDPTPAATGFKDVIVNGVIAVENDSYLGTLSGKVLRRQ